MTMDKVNIREKLGAISEYWQPKIIGEINGSHVKVARLHGEFLWHMHADEEEMFLVIQGQLVIKLRARDVVLNEGEFLVIPRGVEHLPVTEQEVHVMLIEPKTTLNTGNMRNERTVEHPETI
jgi:mannose-6-phosphate isomerase-like protein (cupin superfamily)